MARKEEGVELQVIQHCPSCDRPMTGLEDYPFVEVSSIEVLPPEEIVSLLENDVTERVIRILSIPEVQDYIDFLRTFNTTEGVATPSESLEPLFERDGYFKHSFQIPGPERAFLGMTEEKPEVDGTVGGVSTVGLWLDGPNFGSAGGPTIMKVADLARITYKGRFLQ